LQGGLLFGKGRKLTHKPLLQALNKNRLSRPPFWFMRQAGRYLPEYRQTRQQAGSFLDLCMNPELAAEVTLQPIRRYGMDAAILFSDILVIPYALGQALRFAEGEGPLLSPPMTAERLVDLNAGQLHQRLSPVYETVRLLRQKLPPDKTLIGFAGAPWTVATYMVAGRGTPDQAPAKDWAFADPEGFQRLMDLLVSATIEYLGAQVEAGAEVLQIFDTWAGALPEAEFHRWSIAPTAAIVAGVKARYPQIPIIGFPRHAGALYEAYARLTGVDGVSLDPSVPLKWAADVLQPMVTVQGNLDPRFMVVGGEPMLAAARRIVEVLGEGPFIFNLGHGFTPETPPGNVALLSAYLQGL
jgi:uroporphyrinogen decarboxylase